MEATGPRFPGVVVQLTGEDGNAFAIIGRVRRALDKAEYASTDDVAEFMREATSGDYDHLIATCMAFVEVE